MKKDIVLTIRIDGQLDKTLQSLAEKDDRTIAWVARNLILEALEAHGLWDKKKKVKRRKQ